MMGGLKAVISVPMGIQDYEKDIQSKTWNRGRNINTWNDGNRLNPMSEQALIDTISVELDVRKAQNEEFIIVTPGNYYQDFFEG